MPEGEKHWGAVLIGGDNLPSPVPAPLSEYDETCPLIHKELCFHEMDSNQFMYRSNTIHTAH